MLETVNPVIVEGGMRRGKTYICIVCGGLIVHINRGKIFNLPYLRSCFSWVL